MDAGIFVVSFGTAFYVLGRLGRKQAAKAVKKADTKVRSAAEEREAARKSADLTIRQLGNEKLAVITGDLTTFTEIFSKIENVDFEAGSRAAEMADFVPGGDENRRLQAGIARIRRLERNDDPDLRGLRIRALGVSDAETLFERASGKNEISYSSSINATVKWLMTGKVEGDVFGPDANNSVFVGFGDGPSHTRGEEKASSFRTKMYPAGSGTVRSGIQGRCPPRCPALHSGGGSEEGAGKQHEEFPCPCQSAEAYRRSGRV